MGQRSKLITVDSTLNSSAKELQTNELKKMLAQSPILIAIKLSSHKYTVDIAASCTDKQTQLFSEDKFPWQ